MSVWYDDYLFDLNEKWKKAFHDCEADRFLRAATRIQVDFDRMVLESGDHVNNGIFRLALARATEKLFANLVRPWTREEVENVDMRDPLYQEYDGFRSFLDCLQAATITGREIAQASARIICDELARRGQA